MNFIDTVSIGEFHKRAQHESCALLSAFMHCESGFSSVKGIVSSKKRYDSTPHLISNHV